MAKANKIKHKGKTNKSSQYLNVLLGPNIAHFCLPVTPFLGDWNISLLLSHSYTVIVG